MPFGGIGFDEYGEPIKYGGAPILPNPGGGSGGGGGGGSVVGFGVPEAAVLQGLASPTLSGIPITVKRRGMPKVPGVTPGRPTKNDTVPAMLTPGEIVMNPGVTANPQLAQLLLAINQRGARNMQTGLGPVGMEFGGKIPGYAYGGEVPGFGFGGWLKGIGNGISKAGSKAGSWLKHNVTLKNYGKYVGANAAIAGGILAAPYLAAGAGAVGSGIGGALGIGGGSAAGAAGTGAAGAAGSTAAGAAGTGAAGAAGSTAAGTAGQSTLAKLGTSLLASQAAQGGGGGQQAAPTQFTPTHFQYQGVQQQPIGQGYAEGGMVPGQETGMEGQGEHMMPDGTMMPGQMHDQMGEMPESPESEMQMQGGEGHENPYPSSAVRILQLLLELDEAEQSEYGPGGMEGHAFGGLAGFLKGGANRLSRFQNSRFGRAMMPALTQRLGQAGGAGGALAGFMKVNQARNIPQQTSISPMVGQFTPPPVPNAEPTMPATGYAYGGEVPGFGFGGWLKARFKAPSKPKIDPYGYSAQQAGDIGAARQAGYFDPRGNQALIRSQEQAAQGTADALVRRQMSQANFGGLDPAQRAVAKQQALLQTGRGVQDIMGQTRANAMAAQDQFFKSMYGGAASATEQARLQNDMAKAQAQRSGGLGALAGQVAGAYMGQK